MSKQSKNELKMNSDDQLKCAYCGARIVPKILPYRTDTGLRPIDIFKALVRDGMNTCSEIAAAMNVTGGRVSQLATRAENEGWIKKKKRKYLFTDYQRLIKARLVEQSHQVAKNQGVTKCEDEDSFDYEGWLSKFFTSASV